MPQGAYWANEVGWTGAVNGDNQRVTHANIVCNRQQGLTYGANGIFTIPKAGWYLINWYIACASNTADKHISGGIFISSSTLMRNEGRSNLEHASANRQLTMSGTAIIEIEQDQTVGIGVGSEDSLTVAVAHIGMTIIMIGGT